MKATLIALSALTLLLPATTLPARADVGITIAGLTKVGQCAMTRIKVVETRLEGVPDSGDQVEYTDGGVGVSYDREAGLRGARAGDKVKLCLTSLPTDCPPGDSRGKTYKATDLRTHKSWELPDAEHMCGGA